MLFLHAWRLSNRQIVYHQNLEVAVSLDISHCDTWVEAKQSQTFEMRVEAADAELGNDPIGVRTPREIPRISVSCRWSASPNPRVPA